MKVSIIIPIYNVEKYIERCLHSVISQTYTNIECILVNDCTQDNSFKIAKEFVEKNKNRNPNMNFIFVEHKQNKGLSEARNTGVHHSSGEYIYFLDSDDALQENSIYNLVSTCKSNKYPEVIWGKTITIDAQNNKKLLDPTPNLIPMTNNKDVILGYLNNKWTHIACNKLIKRDIFTEKNIYFYPGIVHEDELWTFELSTTINRMIPCNDITYLYYIGDPNSIQRRPPNEKDFEDNITILEQKCSYIKKVVCPYNLAENIYNLSFLTYLSIVVLHFPISFRHECKRKLNKIMITIKNHVDCRLTTKWYAKLIWILV